MTARLITIPFSHYCEKARWAADWTGFPYREEKHIPGGHFRPVRRIGGRTVPVLVTRHGALKDSSDILRFLDDIARGGPGDAEKRRLYPDDAERRREVEELEELFDETLGPATRLLAYHHGLADRASLRRLVAPSLSLAQRTLFRAALPLLQKQIRRYYRIDVASAEKAERAIRDVFATVEARLAGGKRYLVGDTFTAADLTFASLAGPALLPPGHPSFAPGGSTGIDAVDAFARELRELPAGAHALRMYREHRACSADRARS